MKYLKARWCILINALWIGGWSTYIYMMDGKYPKSYIFWYSIIAFIGLIIPWCFLHIDYFSGLCRICGRKIDDKQSYIVEYFEGKGDFYNHADCYLRTYGASEKEIKRALDYVKEKEKSKEKP
jgi:hypothetical protein